MIDEKHMVTYNAFCFIVHNFFASLLFLYEFYTNYNNEI